MEQNSTLPGVEQPLEEEMYSSWALLILMTLLIGALWTSYYLQLRKIRAVHETVISIMAGTHKKGNVVFMSLIFSFIESL